MISNGLCTNPDNAINKIFSYSNNGNILTIFSLLDEPYKMSCSSNSLVPLLCKGGLTNICTLYNSMLERDASEKDDKSMEPEARIISW